MIEQVSTVIVWACMSCFLLFAWLVIGNYVSYLLHKIDALAGDMFDSVVVIIWPFWLVLIFLGWLYDRAQALVKCSLDYNEGDNDAY